jgi:hypothetical protein
VLFHNWNACENQIDYRCFDEISRNVHSFGLLLTFQRFWPGLAVQEWSGAAYGSRVFVVVTIFAIFFGTSNRMYIICI